MAAPARGNLLLAGASLVAGLALLELGARIAGVDAQRPTGYAPVLTDLRFGRPRNSHGYRDVEHELSKPAGMRRVLAMGDSFTWGAGIEFEDTWAERLERGLTRRRNGAWEVVNLAVPGLAANDYVAQLPGEGLAYAPDVLIIGYVLNDAESKQEMKAREQAYRDRAARPPSVFEGSTLFRLVERRLQARADASERIRYHRQLYDDHNPGWEEAQKSLKTIGSMCREHGLPWILAIFPMFGNPLDDTYPFADIHAKVGEVARGAGARVVDLLPAYRGLRWDVLVVNGALDEHPNEIAHRIAADLLLRALDDVVPFKKD